MMRRILAFGLTAVMMLALGLTSTTAQPKSYQSLEIGASAPMPEHAVKDVSGKELTLKDVANANGVLVMFSCNTCPWVKAWEDRYNKIAQTAEENGIGMIALNPNEAYRDNGDSFEDMQQRAKSSNYQFYYALDRNHRLADAYGATHTPEIFLFNKDLKLVYKGAIDDNARNADKVKNHYLLDALNELAAGKQIDPKATKSLGCSIKRVR